MLKKQPRGFVLMVEGASIDKQAHHMDTERWLLPTAMKTGSPLPRRSATRSSPS